jgi:uncharacterized protein YbjT (DUF2867 family)
MRADVFVTGGTGYMGRRLIPTLVSRGHRVRALTRPGSELKVPAGATPIIGNVLERETYAWAITPNAVVIHLVGTPHPSPSKAAQFEAVDFVSARECIAAARQAGAQHFVYVSVAQPAPIMRAYVDVRARVEQILRDASIPHTVLRPWYVLGPGHRWAHLLRPMYAALSLFPSTREGATRLGLVTLPQMIAALTWAVETAGTVSRVVGVPEIRRHRL